MPSSSKTAHPIILHPPLEPPNKVLQKSYYNSCIPNRKHCYNYSKKMTKRIKAYPGLCIHLVCDGCCHQSFLFSCCCSNIYRLFITYKSSLLNSTSSSRRLVSIARGATGCNTLSVTVLVPILPSSAWYHHPQWLPVQVQHCFECFVKGRFAPSRLRHILNHSLYLRRELVHWLF